MLKRNISKNAEKKGIFELVFGNAVEGDTNPVEYETFRVKLILSPI